jgi:hypothetical protein
MDLLTIAAEVYGEEIDEGVALLDRMIGLHWPHNIRLRKLNLAHPSLCVIGQLYGNYFEAIYLHPILKIACFNTKPENNATKNKLWKMKIQQLKKDKRRLQKKAA